jgi:hypothetical protein
MRKKTATVAQSSSSKPASESKPVAAGDPTPNGKVVPEETVRLRAYQRWEAAGMPGGDGVKFWLEAEQELLQAK